MERGEEGLHRCPFCAGRTRVLFSTRDLWRPQIEDQYEVGWCATCRYGKVVGDFTAERVAAFYDIPYYTHQAEAAPQRREPFKRRLIRWIAWRLDDGRNFAPQEFGAPGEVVDVGCGSGEQMRKLSAAGFRVVGVEPDPKARAVSAAYGEVHPGTAEALPAHLGPFDYALLSHVLEHTINPEAALKNVRALLGAGGKLIVEVPNCEAAGFWAFGAEWPWTDVPRHLHFFTPGSLRKLLESAGFHVGTVLFTGFTRQFLTPGTSWESRWARKSWRLMLRTARAPAERKYDSIRMHATRT